MVLNKINISRISLTFFMFELQQLFQFSNSWKLSDQKKWQHIKAAQSYTLSKNAKTELDQACVFAMEHISCYPIGHTRFRNLSSTQAILSPRNMRINLNIVYCEHKHTGKVTIWTSVKKINSNHAAKAHQMLNMMPLEKEWNTQEPYRERKAN